MKVKELLEKLNDANPEAEVITSAWNGFVETYAVIDTVWTDWKYANIYPDFFGTPGKIDNRFFLSCLPDERSGFSWQQVPCS